ncbi:DUF4129 domain-containing protein [Natrononativus amylolyticus]|uniref:DUF4129 domain-containing protein n=1 Tax=Natrononativus amylolyticus TaxID=2963434 RepID=UPI0020CE2327|nr:DUF4129 domain-containing protein [Natrononativus amylolyticus]
MGYNLRFAALIACCVLAVVVAAAFFPAAGYGDAPDREAVESDYYADTENEFDFGIDLTPPERDGSATDDEDDSTDTDTERDEESDDENESDDESPAGSSDGSSSNALFEGAIGWLFLVGFGVAGLVVCWRLTDPKTGEIPDHELPEGVLPTIQFRLRRIPQLTMVATIGASRAVPALLDGVASTTRDVGAGVGAVARDVGRGLAGAAVAVPVALAATSRGFGSLFSLSLTDGASSLLGGVRNRTRRSRSSTPAERPTAEDDESAPEEPEFGPRTIEEAWEEMAAAVPVSRRTVRTPGEYARAAVEAGLPAEPVSQLTEAFREVRYGNFPPSPDRTRRARTAFERLEDGRDDEGDDR